MRTKCERDEFGREVGVIEHEGREFRALGASVQGSYVSGYIGKGDTLTTWNGQTMLDCRSERSGEWQTDGWGDTFGIIFYLTNRRAIIGYALGVGCLFRGELIEIEGHSDAIGQCRALCEHWLEIDADDAERFEADQDD
jgi:hypothetical protein